VTLPPGRLRLATRPVALDRQPSRRQLELSSSQPWQPIPRRWGPHKLPRLVGEPDRPPSLAGDHIDPPPIGIRCRHSGAQQSQNRSGLGGSSPNRRQTGGNGNPLTSAFPAVYNLNHALRTVSLGVVDSDARDPATGRGRQPIPLDRQTKEAATEFYLQLPRHISTLPGAALIHSPLARQEYPNNRKSLTLAEVSAVGHGRS
jgi:hypothetical protein